EKPIGSSFLPIRSSTKFTDRTFHLLRKADILICYGHVQTRNLQLATTDGYNQLTLIERSCWRIPFVAHRPPIRLGIIAKPNEPRASIVANTIAEWARSHAVALLVDNNLTPPHSAIPSPQEEVAASSDLLVVLGGDGTMIGAARLVAGRGTPVLGINLGWLGYLTEFAVEDTILALHQFLAGDFEVERRTMLDWECLRNGSHAGSGSVLN